MPCFANEDIMFLQ